MPDAPAASPRSRIWNSALDATTKFVALAYLDSDKGNGIHPSLEYIAWRTGFALSTVKKSLRNLRKKGREILKDVGFVSAFQVGGLPRGRVVKYELRPDHLPTRSAWVPVADRGYQTAAVGQRQQPSGARSAATSRANSGHQTATTYVWKEEVKENPPYPPLTGGRPFTRQERKAATDLRKRYGRCPHNVTCQSVRRCEGLIAAYLREEFEKGIAEYNSLPEAARA